MKTQLVKAKVNTFGKDLTGDVVQMDEGSIHIIMSSEVEYFEDRPDQFELLENAEIVTWVFNTSGVVIGFRMPDGSVKLLTEFGSGGGDMDLTELEAAITAMQATITAIQATNTTQSNSIAALQASITGINNTLTGLQTQATANANAITSISAAIAALNLDQVAETGTKKHFTSTIKAAIEGLMATLLAGIPVVNNQIRYPCVVSISDATQNEGAPLVFNVVCLNKTGATFAYSLIDLTTNSVDFNHTPTFNNGVTLAGSVVTVPAGVEAFTMTFTVNDDVVFEPNETFSVAIGGVTATGTINNNDGGSARSVETVSSPVVMEGGLLVYTVALSGMTTQEETYGLVISGTADVDDRTSITFSNGVTSPANNCVVPIGVASFTISIQTTQDAFVEGNETLVVTVGGVSGTGTINNDDVVVSAIYPSATVTEGAPLEFNVELIGTSVSPKTFTFARSGTAVAGTDFVDSPTFSAGVTLSGGTLTVPSGVTMFTVTYPTISDTVDEADKTILLVIGTANGTGIILSDDGLLAPFSTNIFEMPYYLLTTDQRAALAATDGYAMALVERNTSGRTSTGYNLRKSSDNTTFTVIGDASYAPTASLLNPVDEDDLTFTLSSGTDLSSISFSGSPVIAFIGTEAICITAYNSTTQVFTVRRGILDTVPKKHGIGDKIFVIISGMGYDPAEYVAGNIRYYKALSKASAETMSEAAVASKSITFNSRASRPYPPGRFRVNSMFYPASVPAGDITISWQNRNRITQITDLIDYDDDTSTSGGSGSTSTVTSSDNTGSTVTGTTDNELDGFAPTTNRGAGTQAYIDNWVAPDVNVMLALKFPIPSGVGTIGNAKLRLYLTEKGGTKTALSVYEILRDDWSESESTYTQYKAGVPWTVAGAQGVGSDRGATLISSFNVASTTTGQYIEFTGANLNALIQNAINTSKTHISLIVQFSDLAHTSQSYVRFVTSEGTNGQRPALVYDLTTSGTPDEVDGEVGQTHTVQFFDGETMVREVTGITGTQYVYTNANIIADGDYDVVRVKLFSVRDGLTSWQAYEHSFSRPFTGVPTPTAIAISGGMEGSNAVFTVTMSGAYFDQVDHGYTLTGTFQLADINPAGITFSNDVTDNGDGTLSVPAGVSTFTVTIPIVSDGLSESGENIILSMGEVSNIIALSDPT